MFVAMGLVETGSAGRKARQQTLVKSLILHLHLPEVSICWTDHRAETFPSISQWRALPSLQQNATG